MRFDECLPRRARKRAYASYGVAFYIAFVRSAGTQKDGAAMLMGTLRSLAKAGYCVVVIEHRLDMVLPFVDTVWHIGDRTVKRIEDKAAYLQAQTAKIGDSCKPFEVGAPLFTLKSVKFSVREYFTS